MMQVLFLTGRENWENWAGNLHCEPQHIYYPKTLDELTSCIQESVSKGLNIRIAGTGYSRSNLVYSDDCLIDTRHLNKVLSIDTKKMQVRVQAGCTVAQINKYLASFGLALSNQAAVSEISIAGALCTASHGTGHTGTLSSFIAEIELIDAFGKMHTVSPNSEPNIFKAACVSIGALGVFYSITLQCEPLFYVLGNHTKMGLEDFIAHYQELNKTHDHFQGIWDVNSNYVMIDTWNRVDPSIAQKENHISDIQVCYDALSWFKVDDNVKDLAAEIAIPITMLPEALEKVRALIKKYQNRGLNNMNVVVIRFVEKDNNSLLSPASDGPVAYINIGAPVSDDYLPFYKEFEDSMLALKGKPHWGKMNFLNYQKISLLYGKNVTTFIDVKNQLDPFGVFSNNYINELVEQKLS